MSTLRVPTERDLKHIWAAFDKDKDGEWNTKELNDFTLQCRDRTMKMVS